MARDKVLLRRTDGSGAGYLFSREDARKFLKDNPDYVEESSEETEANQRAADEKAAEASEDKAVRRAENKAK